MTMLLMLVAAVTLVALPIWFTYTVWRAREESRWLWWLQSAAAGAAMTFLYVFGRWDLVSYYLRLPLLALVVAAIAAGALRATPRPWFPRRRPRLWLTTGGAIVTLVVFAALVGLSRREPDAGDRAVLLESPLRNGTFYVGQGGNSLLLNHHNSNRAQQYAIDVVQLNAVGLRASGLYPGRLDQYAIFGSSVYSPCDGTVLAAVDGLMDYRPSQRDSGRPAGNHVVIACRGARVLLAHLRSGSVRVQEGEHVSPDDVIGEVGNSGNTSEPHLHVHAVRGDGDVMTGEGVPMRFDGEIPKRNTLLR